MTIYIMMSMLVIGYEDHLIAIELSQLQSFELVDKGLQKEGGIAEFYLKDRKESIVFPVLKNKEWKELKSYLVKELIEISRYTTKDRIIATKEEVPF